MKKLIKIIFPLLLLLLLSSCDNGDRVLTVLRPNDVILAFGDSLTSGVGVRSDLSYPAQLNHFLSRKVVNAGIPGEVSAEGLVRLPGLLDQVEPALLIICHGGNDLLRKLDRGELRANLQGMYEAAKQRKIEVVMIAVPQLGLGLHDVPLYEELANEFQIPLVKGILGELLADPQFKSDPVHLNGQGYRKLAEAVADLLSENGALR